MLEFLGKISWTDAFAIGAFLGLLFTLFKLFLYKHGYKKDSGVGCDSIIAIVLGIIFAFGDDK